MDDLISIAWFEDTVTMISVAEGEAVLPEVLTDDVTESITITGEAVDACDSPNDCQLRQ